MSFARTDSARRSCPENNALANSYRGETLVAAALDGTALVAPAQHAAGEIGNIAEPRFAQDVGRHGRTATGATHGDDGAVLYN